MGRTPDQAAGHAPDQTASQAGGRGGAVRRAIGRFELLWIAIAVTAALLLVATQPLTDLDRRLTDWRMGQDVHAASGDIVFVGLDAKALDAVGVWPWPRSVHARIIGRLDALGAREIAVDIDFSTPSSPVEDEALVAAVRDASASVILPVFVRSASADAPGALAVSRPMPALADVAWLASVTVVPESDGVVRKVPVALDLDGEGVPSMPAMLAGAATGANVGGPPVSIHFGIDPATVPTVSAADLLSGRVPRSAIDGKRVVYGAHAVELRDTFAVPVHGVMSGPLLQIVAAETLERDLAPVPVALWKPMMATLALLLGLAAATMRASVGFRLAILLFVSLALELAALALLKYAGLALPAADVHLLIFVATATLGLVTLDVQGLAVRLLRTERADGRRLLDRIVSDNTCAVLVVDETGRTLLANDKVDDILLRPGTTGADGAAASRLPGAVERDARMALERVRQGAPGPVIRGKVRLGSGEAARHTEYAVTVSRIDAAGGERRGGAMRRTGAAHVACVTAWDTTERHAHEATLDRIARHDGLTGLLRRDAFAGEIDRFMDGSRHLLVGCLRFGRLDEIALTLGRDQANAVLCQLADRVRQAATDSVMVSRLGDATLAFLLAGTDEAECRGALERLRGAVERPVSIGRSGLHIPVRMGTAGLAPHLCRRASGGGATLLQRAELALDEVARSRTLHGVEYRKGLSNQLRSARTLNDDMWQAIARGDMHLSYQPQVELESRRIVGAEALARWRHPIFGAIPPDRFVAMAEANGFIHEFGAWTIEAVCRAAASLPRDLTVAVNVSPVQLGRGRLVRTVATALEETGCAPERLWVEMTESALVEDADKVMDELRQVRALGVRIALDDFGTGFSSLSYLARFPTDKVKVDRSLVTGIDANRINQAILRSMATLCEGIGATLLCEGVETEVERAFLASVSVDEGQGWMFGRPAPLHELCGALPPGIAAAAGRPPARRAA